MHLKEDVSRNLHKCKQVDSSIVVVCFKTVFILQFVVDRLLLNLHFFILMLLLYFRVFINHVIKAIIFVFRSWLFKNTISIFIYICSVRTIIWIFIYLFIFLYECCLSVSSFYFVHNWPINFHCVYFKFPFIYVFTYFRKT